MIYSGRKPKKSADSKPSVTENTRAARYTAILGILIFTVFFCSSVSGPVSEENAVQNSFGESAYPVFAPVDETKKPQTDVGIIEDTSIWSYLESIIERFIHGDK